MSIGVETVTLLTLTIESSLFALFTVLFAITMYIMFFRRGQSMNLNKPIIAVAVLMYVVAFAHLVVMTRRAIVAFINMKDPSAFLSGSTDAYYIVKVGFYVSQTVIGDSFIIYRLYIVWERDKRLLFSALIFWLSSLVCGITPLIDAAQVPPTTPIFAPLLKHWIISFFSLTLFINFSCTALIALKVWWAERRLAGFAHSSRSLGPLMSVVIESGAVYSAALISLMGTYLSGTWAYYIVLDSMPQIIGIVFSLIIVRMGLFISSTETVQLGRLAVQAGRHDGENQHMPMQPLVVQIEHSKSVRDDTGNSVLGGSAGNSSSVTIDRDHSIDKPVNDNALP